MSNADPAPSDAWDTPPVGLDPELVETSKQLMAKSVPIVNSEPIVPEAPPDEKSLLIAQLKQEKQRLFARNVSLVAENAQLRVENQQLRHQLQQQQRSQNWLTHFFRRFSRG